MNPQGCSIVLCLYTLQLGAGSWEHIQLVFGWTGSVSQEGHREAVQGEGFDFPLWPGGTVVTVEQTLLYNLLLQDCKKLSEYKNLPM